MSSILVCVRSWTVRAWAMACPADSADPGANPYFAVEELTCEGQISWTEPVRRFVLYFLLEGNLELMWSAGSCPWIGEPRSWCLQR